MNNAQAKNFRQRFLILHYTAENFANSIAHLTGPNVSVHYLVPTFNTIDSTYPNDALKIYCIVEESDRAWHAGVSTWGDATDLNDTSISIEIVNLANNVEFQPYPEEQIALVIKLCKNILLRYPDIKPTHVLGHSDISVGRKQDPGPLFPWEKLHKHGIGAWFDTDTVKHYIQLFKDSMPSVSTVIEKLSGYGYNTNVDQTDLFKAFQMHFRQSNYSGEFDIETAAIAYALYDKYVLSTTNKIKETVTI